MKFSEINGLAVVGVAGAQKLGTVDNAVVDLKAQQVLALLVQEGHILRKEGAVPLADMVGVGSDAVTIHDASDLNDLSKFPHLQGQARMTDIIGAKVVATDGDDLGRVGDIEFDLPGGQITAYLLHEGIINRLRGEQHDIPREKVQSIGRNLIVVTSG